MKLIKNKFTMLAGTLILSLALTACGSESGNEPADDADAEFILEEEVDFQGEGEFEDGEFIGDDDGIDLDESIHHDMDLGAGAEMDDE